MVSGEFMEQGISKPGIQEIPGGQRRSLLILTISIGEVPYESDKT